jgi:hypothetical protein
MQRIEELIASVQDHGNAVVRASTVELVRSLLDLHRAGLSRMLKLVDAQNGAAPFLFDQFVRDDLISRLLLLHDLHPTPLETRVCQALEHVRPLLELKCSSATLLEATHEAIRLHLVDCPEDVRGIVEQAILEAAPDVLKIEFADSGAGSRLVPLPLV